MTQGTELPCLVVSGREEGALICVKVLELYLLNRDETGGGL